ncbi:MAG: hypothetical protein ABIT37_04225 [Luteolibacter sp.]
MFDSVFISGFRKSRRLLAHAAVFCCLLSALSAQTPETEDIRGPRGVVEIPVPKKTPVAIWWGIGGGLIAVAAVWLLMKKLEGAKKRKSPPALALASLTELAATREALAAEAFAYQAAKTVRQYISEQFGLAAPRRTTEEFLHDLAKDESSPLVSENDHLRLFLKSCDLAKFAGTNLSMGQRDELLSAARGFIEMTSAPVIKPKGGAA